MNKEEMAVAKAAVNKFRMEKVRSFITSEGRIRARLGMVGQKRSPESKERMRQAALGRKHSPETIIKIKEARAKQVITPKMLQALADNRGVNSKLYKGDGVGYRALHRWLDNNYGKSDTCEKCGKPNLTGHWIHWANKSGEYKRDISDWLRLCAKCHKEHDSI